MRDVNAALTEKAADERSALDLSGCEASPPPEDEVPSEGCVKSRLLLFR